MSSSRSDRMEEDAWLMKIKLKGENPVGAAKEDKSKEATGDQVPIDCSDPTSNGQVFGHECHPWIGNADTHSTRGIIIEFQSHTYYIESS